jgi:hypothetical protein
VPPGITHVVLADQSELANGWAFPLPYNTIVLNAAWPAASEFSGQTDDWLRMVFSHEYAHIVHLDRSARWARLVRHVFGRAPLAFPNLYLPAWQIEGLATFEESRRTPSGRLNAGDFGAIASEAVRSRTIPALDRVNGGLLDWPGGLAAYAYGSGFHAYLAGRFGPDALSTLAEATAGAVPFVGSRAFRAVYGHTLGDLWREYKASLDAGASAVDGEAGRRLTRQGFVVTGPRFTRPACATCQAEVVFTGITPHAFPSLYAVDLAGGPPRRLATRYLGSTAGVGPGVVLFDQRELRRNVGLFGDLFLLDRATGGVHALSRSARLLDPDLSPDGGMVAAVRQRSVGRELVVMPVVLSPIPRLGEVRTLLSEPDTQFNAPRWSPDGRRIAVGRHRLGSLPEVIVVDADTAAVHAVASFEDRRAATPAWRPDGEALVVSVTGPGEPFNLYEIDIATLTVRQITRTSGGALWPDVSADGRTIVYAGYTADGFDLFSMEYPAADLAADAGSAWGRTRVRPRPPDRTQGGDRTPVRPQQSQRYSPGRTLAPTAWTPLVERRDNQTRLGLAAGGADVLQYHRYAASATWRAPASPATNGPAASTPDWRASYAYDRWQPTLFTAASSSTSHFSGLPFDGTQSRAVLRERQLEAGVLFPVRRVRVSHQALASALYSADRYWLDEGIVAARRAIVRGGWASSSARSYGFSISREHGATVGVTAERSRQDRDGASTAATFTADVRAYAPGLARHHVVALRSAAGTSTGGEGARRTFLLGGAPADAGVLSFSRDALSLLRGFPAQAFAGTRVAVINAEYRWPLGWPQRGLGTWPLFVKAVHGAAFADAGHAWSDAFRSRDVKAAAGVELSFDLVAGYAMPLTTTMGVAWGRDGARRAERGARWYVRVGRAF